jgi:uncharacterized membrane protein
MRRKRWAILTVPAAVVLAGLLLFAWCRRSRLYTVTVLPQMRTQVVVPCAINDKGQIVGVCQGRFYLWERGQNWRELGRASQALGLHINNAGQITVTINDPNDRPHAFLWDPNEGLTMLEIPENDESVVWALNNRGQVVGRCWRTDTPSMGRVFLWSKTDGVRFMGGPDSEPMAVNDAGQVIGRRGSKQPPQVVLWTPAGDGSPIEALPPSGAFWDINNSGYVSGKGFNFDARRQYVFLWRQDRGVEWLVPVENEDAHVRALNDANQVVVWGESRSSRLEKLINWHIGPYLESFVWTREKGRVSLDGYVLDERGEYFQIADMNNHGCILGTVSSKSGEIRRTVLLEPIPKRWRK